MGTQWGSRFKKQCWFNPFRTAVPFWGQSSQISSSFVPKRDCGSKGVKRKVPVKEMANHLERAYLVRRKSYRRKYHTVPKYKYLSDINIDCKMSLYLGTKWYPFRFNTLGNSEGKYGNKK